VKFPEIRSAVIEPLFNGTLYFVRVHFTVQSEKNAVISVGAADINTAMLYASCVRRISPKESQTFRNVNVWMCDSAMMRCAP
jgi:hypothetical protein